MARAEAHIARQMAWTRDSWAAERRDVAPWQRAEGGLDVKPRDT